MHESGLFLNDWKEAEIELLKDQFDLVDAALSEVEILLASYSRDAFCGEAFVLFCRGGKLYEINASHDSTDGFEGQWEPEEAPLAALRYRLERGRLGQRPDGRNIFADELIFLLLELEAEGFN
ncbi:hypothetical protein [Candidatus Vondammii sp. HM_W22]|uniref:hypothetical protein n=1 Tax=Candidatus Vondammii sp. HM_W22 TaxID=2687299 RepID=UPI001F13A94F|nr:hypothetical protein [Candidatus Vondammii sp. HM_W22]